MAFALCRVFRDFHNNVVIKTKTIKNPTDASQHQWNVSAKLVLTSKVAWKTIQRFFLMALQLLAFCECNHHEFAGGCFSDKSPAILSIKFTCLHRLAAASINVDWSTQRIDKIWILKKQEHFYEFFSAARLKLCLVMWFLLVFIIPLQWVNIFAQFWNLEGWC